VRRCIPWKMTGIPFPSGEALLRLEARDDAISLMVEDEGTGFYPGTVQSVGDAAVRFRLFSTQERLALHDGRLDTDSRPGGGGNRLTVSIPHALACRQPQLTADQTASAPVPLIEATRVTW
jgi:signal transduction histidine kinase